MKLKQSVEDFFVEELTAAQPLDNGEFALYRLEKRGWTTPDALQALMQHKDYQTTQRYINMARQLNPAVAELYVPAVPWVTARA